MKRLALFSALLALLLVVANCASTSPFETKSSDLKALVGSWEEEWPGQADKDTYEIKLDGDQVQIKPLKRADVQQAKNIVFQHKRLTFTLVLDEHPVYYDLVLVHPTLLAGTAKGGARNFDEKVSWYKKR